MSNFDLEAGKRFREQGEIVDALRCLKAAVEEDRDAFEAYVELAFTYLLAFQESGDPLCLDSARNVCVSGLRREPPRAQHDQLREIQEKVEHLLLESQKAEMDAMNDVISEQGPGPEVVADPGLDPDLSDEMGKFMEETTESLEDERSH